MAALSWKKLLVVTMFGALLFVGSFVASGQMKANELSCDPASIWYDVFGNPQCPAGGEPALGGGQMMMASYYGWSHAGSPTASGAPFDPTGYTAAHKTLPFGTPLLVNHGGSTVVVTVNDRGPFVDGRDIDLSQAAAEAIGLTGPGVAPVEVTVL